MHVRGLYAFSMTLGSRDRAYNAAVYMNEASSSGKKNLTQNLVIFEIHGH